LATRLCRIGVFALALVAISGPLTVIVVVVLAVVSTSVRLVARQIEALGHAETRAWEVMAQRIVEMLRTRRTIRVFGRERVEQAQTLQAFVPPASELLVAALMLIVLWVRAGVPGELPVVLTFLALLYRLHPQVQQLDGARVSLAAAAAPTAAVRALLDAMPAPRPSGTRPVEPLSREIAFHDVSYAYDERGPSALLHASFQL